jgi:hypothetical protein
MDWISRKVVVVFSQHLGWADSDRHCHTHRLFLARVTDIAEFH